MWRVKNAQQKRITGMIISVQSWNRFGLMVLTHKRSVGVASTHRTDISIWHSSGVCKCPKCGGSIELLFVHICSVCVCVHLSNPKLLCQLAYLALLSNYIAWLERCKFSCFFVFLCHGAPQSGGDWWGFFCLQALLVCTNVFCTLVIFSLFLRPNRERWRCV